MFSHLENIPESCASVSGRVRLIDRQNSNECHYRQWLLNLYMCLEFNANNANCGRLNINSPSRFLSIIPSKIFKKPSRRCGVTRICRTVLWNFPIGPFFLHSSRSFLIWAADRFWLVSSSNDSASFPKRKAFAARFRICPRHLTRLASGSLISGRSFRQISRRQVSLEPWLSPIKYPRREAISKS